MLLFYASFIRPLSVVAQTLQTTRYMFWLPENVTEASFKSLEGLNSNYYRKLYPREQEHAFTGECGYKESRFVVQW